MYWRSGPCWLSVKIFTSLRRLKVCGIKRDVNIALICEGNPADLLGQWVLVHVGFASEHHRRR